ncbi:GNAT family N-acetyltransferase [Roseovarius autotrophicus]|uniref:GNAT family N-acetyltransferase n=1 Tax=Roseovarius autotrophicus TaxID=2824121 RepID=UPI001A0644D1|nr:GNAT family N-acetyltransferase [Roseovarius autotrophicus]MBE0452311.1 GNAT family N-acetyltransferase [Roseovarius sp.]
MTALTLARPDDLARLLAMVMAREAERGQAVDEAALGAALMPLLEGSPHGAAYLVGPPRAPIGYVLLSFGWSVASGGLVGRVEVLHIRRAVRGRGIGAEVLVSLPRALAGVGLRALDVAVARENTRARALFERRHFVARDDEVTMRLALPEGRRDG